MARLAPAQKLILVVDGHPSICQWLRREIGRQPDLTVGADAPDAVTAWTALTAQPPDLLILGLALAGSHGLDFLRDLRARGHQLPVLVFSQYPAELYAGLVRDAGAQGFLNKGAERGPVLTAIRTLLAGGVAFPAGTPDTASAIPVVPGRPALTEREVQVFQLIGLGLTNPEIAAQLHLSVHRVENLRSSLSRKVGAPNAAKLTVIAALYLHLGGRAKANLDLPQLPLPLPDRAGASFSNKGSFPHTMPGVFPTVPDRPILDADASDYHI